MNLDQNPTYVAPDDWRAYSGVLSRRIFAFLIDYAIVLLLCIPAAVIVFFLGVITLGLGFFLYPALFVIVAVLYFGVTLSGPSQASPGMRAMGIAMARMDGRRDRFPSGHRAYCAFLGHQLGFDAAYPACRPVYGALSPRSRLPARHRHGQNLLI